MSDIRMKLDRRRNAGKHGQPVEWVYSAVQVKRRDPFAPSVFVWCAAAPVFFIALAVILGAFSAA